MQNVLNLIQSIDQYNFNSRTFHELENGIQISLRIGYDGFSICARSENAKQKLVLSYSIDIPHFEKTGECKLALKSVDTGCKIHITKTSRIQTPNQAVKTLSDTTTIMNILSLFIKVIDRKLSLVESSLATVLQKMPK
ncbi:hypothetical protein [Photobacterium damselae]|uniref:hypothetical protein n=1 Tax=Photobacterium damselae TaxID=38293 RepID=UPI00406758F4